MKKKITVTYCDVCDSQEYVQEKCYICHKDTCADCEVIIFNEDSPFEAFIEPRKLCKFCAGCKDKDDDGESIIYKKLKPFFKDKKVKEHFIEIDKALDEYLIKISLANNLNKNKKGEQN
jgi:hypothetical protein